MLDKFCLFFTMEQIMLHNILIVINIIVDLIGKMLNFVIVLEFFS